MVVYLQHHHWTQSPKMNCFSISVRILTDHALPFPQLTRTLPQKSHHGISLYFLSFFLFSIFLLSLISFFIIIYLFIYFLLYNIVLVLPYNNMHLPQVYTCSPSWTPLQLPLHTIPLNHPSAPAPSFLYSASNLDWRFISYVILYMF